MNTAHRSHLTAIGSLLLLVLALGLLITSTPAYAEAPGNDDFDFATEIDWLPFADPLYTGEATAASDDPTTCYNTSNSVWWVYTPLDNMRLAADTIGSTYDTTLSVHTGSRGDLAQRACNDDYYGLQSFVSFDAVAGETYYFMVTDLGWGGGDLVFNAYEVVPPTGDDFDDPFLIPELPFSAWTDASSMTRAADDPWSACGDWSPTVWFAYTPAESMWIEADPYGGNYDESIAVYTGLRGSLDEVTCNTSWWMGETLHFFATAGETYYFMVSPTWYDMYVTLSVRAGASPPLNDDFDAATVIGALPFSESVDASQATRSNEEPYPSCGGGYQTIWYAFTPTETMWLETDPYGYYENTIAVYTGSRYDLTEVACRSDWFYGESLRLQALGGTTYYFQLSPSWYDTWVTLNLRQGAAPPPNDDFDSATIIGALPFSDTVDVRYATNAWDDPPCATYYGPSIWYQFTAPGSARLELTMTPYGTMGIYTGSRGTLEEVACGNYWDGPLFFEPEAGRTYYIAISAMPEYGPTVTTTLQEALAISVTVDPTGTFNMKAGTASVSGTVTCSRPAVIQLQILVSQPVGRVATIQAGAYLWEFACDGTTPWEVTVTPQSGKFAGGPATVTATAHLYPYPSVEVTAGITFNRATK